MKHFRILMIGWTLLFSSANASACPFCNATQQTISEEIVASEISVIAKLVKAAPLSDDPANFDLAGKDTGLATFQIESVLRGDEDVAEKNEIKVVYFGAGETSKRFLINALSIESLVPNDRAVPRIDWTTPLPLTSRGVEYVNQLLGLPEKGAKRLEFFQQYFEDEDPLLAQDAYDEFARAPYQEVIDLKENMDRDQLLHWIEDPMVGPTRRRLYLTMLGVCGQPEDAKQLETHLLYDYPLVKPGVSTFLTTAHLATPVYGATLVDELIRADIRRRQQCLDALVAAYLKLIGPAGLPLVEEKFLKNPDAEYSHTYAALMALRFHGDEETGVIPRDRLLDAMRHLLDNDEIADQVVTDLTRYEDWTVMDRLIELFKASDENGWIRQPVVSYLLTAKEQTGEVGVRAGTALAELEELDPETVKRAKRYMAFGAFASSRTKAAPDAQLAKDSVKAGTASSSAPLSKADPKPAPLAKMMNGESPNQLTLIVVPLIAVLLFIGIFTLLLRGADVRTGNETN